MRKILSLLLCLLLAASLMLSLCACNNGGNNDDGSQPGGSPNPEEPAAAYLGKWKTIQDFTNVLEAYAYVQGLGQVNLKDFYYTVTLELKEDGTFIMDYDRTAAANTVEWIRYELKLRLEDNADNLNQILQDRNLTLDALIDSLLEPFTPESLAMATSGYYKVENGKIYISNTQTFNEDNADKIVVEGDSLIVGEDDEEMEFERVTEE